MLEINWIDFMLKKLSKKTGFLNRIGNSKTAYMCYIQGNHSASFWILSNSNNKYGWDTTCSAAKSAE